VKLFDRNILLRIVVDKTERCGQAVSTKEHAALKALIARRSIWVLHTYSNYVVTVAAEAEPAKGGRMRRREFADAEHAELARHARAIEIHIDEILKLLNGNVPRQITNKLSRVRELVGSFLLRMGNHAQGEGRRPYFGESKNDTVVEFPARH
jgi:plasmid maintenance system antidote protein VapI